MKSNVNVTTEEPKFFTNYIYSNNKEYNKGLDIFIEEKNNCQHLTKEGHVCEDCYLRGLRSILIHAQFPQKMKRLLTYQIGLYENPEIWIKELKSWMEHNNLVRYELQSLVEDTLEEVYEDLSEPSIPANLIYNDFTGANIGQVNQGGVNNQTINISDLFDQLRGIGFPESDIKEGEETLADADKSDSLKKIASNWVKSLPFKVIEKCGEWAVKNPDKLEELQNKFLVWLS